MGRKKGINKCKVGFSIDFHLWKDLDEWCELNNINKSKLMNKIIKDFLKTKEVENESLK